MCLLSSSTLSPKALQAMSFLEPLTGLKTCVFSAGALKGPDCVLSTTHVTYKPCRTEHRGHKNRNWDSWRGHKPRGWVLLLSLPDQSWTRQNNTEWA